MTQVILVDNNDSEIGVEEKLAAHQKGLLHRAFSVFIFNNNHELLLQKRAVTKYHSGGLWTNTCCSHPFPNEEVADAASRRLFEEMGFKAELTYLTNFIYKAEVGDGLIENEFDHVFIGYYNGKVLFNPEEVDDFKFVNLDFIEVDILNNPQKYTVWFKIIFNTVKNHLNNLSQINA